LSEITKQVGKTPAQVLLKWALEKDLSVIPKSVNPTHIEENIDLDFELTGEHMKLLDSIGSVKKYAWNPDTVV